MLVNHLRFICLCSLLIISGTVLSQRDSRIYSEYTGAGQTSVCAYKSIILHEAPGRNSRKLGTIVFTEEMEHLGQESLLKDERRNYVLVRTHDGKEGWVDDTYIVKDGGVVVLLDDSRVYQRPATYSSSTTDFFRAGEIAILTDFQDNWVKLVSYRKEIVGWVEGYDKLSAESYDIEIAAMLAQALAIQDPDLRQQELRKIGSTRGFTSSDMARIVKKTLTSLETSALRSSPSAGEIYLDSPDGEDFFASDRYRDGALSGTGGLRRESDDNPVYRPNSTTNSSNAPKPGIAERTVVDMATGRTYLQIRETGTVQPVKAKKPKSIYYCYHKTLPIGSKVLLEIPEQQGYVPLEVVAKLRKDNPNVVGLGSEVIKAVFGVVKASEVGNVSISYPKQ